MKVCFTHIPQNPSTRVKFGQLNPLSTRNKSTLVLDAISTHCFDIFALTETWVSDNANNVTKYYIVPQVTMFYIFIALMELRRRFFDFFQLHKTDSCKICQTWKKENLETDIQLTKSLLARR